MSNNPLGKLCTGCGKGPPCVSFSKDCSKPDGLRSRCNQCKKEYRHDHAEEIRAYDNLRIKSDLDFVKTFKSVCTDCHKDRPPYAMEFDHISEEKFKAVSQMVRRYPVTQILAEIGKCEPVCRNCHRIRTTSRLRKDGRDEISAVRKYQLRKQAFVNQLKSSPCSDCGEQFPPEAMDFDHVGPKKMSISDAIRSAGYAALIEELEKTELVCAVCHAIRTHSRAQKEAA